MKVMIDTNRTTSIYKIVAKEIENLEGYTNNLNNEMDNISQFWQGSDGRAYVMTMKNKLLKSLEEVIENLRNYSNNLELVGKCYETLDDSFMNKNIGGDK